MKTIKILSIAAAATAMTLSAQASVSFSGTALLSQTTNPLSLVNGQVGIFINNNNNAAWSSFFGTGTIGNGLSLFSSSTYTPTGTSDSYSFLTNVAVSGSTTLSLSGGFTADLSGGISTGDQFAVLVFSNSTTTTIAGDTFRIFRGTGADLAAGGWLMPADAAAIGYTTNSANFGSSVQQIRNTSFLIGSGTVVVPEPSTYALLAMSAVAIAGYVVRRRRRA